MALLGIATVRMIGLWVNGNWRRSPTLRFLTSAAGACVWLWLARLFSDDSYSGLNTGALVYLAVGLFDLYAAGRSLADQGKDDQRHALARPGERLMLADAHTAILAIPDGVLKAAGAVLGAAATAGFYL